MVEETGEIKIMIEKRVVISTLQAKKKSKSSQLKKDMRGKTDLMTDLKEKIEETLKKEEMITK